MNLMALIIIFAILLLVLRLRDALLYIIDVYSAIHLAWAGCALELNSESPALPGIIHCILKGNLLNQA